MTRELKSALTATAVTIAVVLGTIAMFKWTTLMASAEFTVENPAPKELFRHYRFFATSTAQNFFATSTTATSTNIAPWFDSNGRYDDGSLNIAGAKKVEFYFSRGDTRGTGNTGSSNFRVQVTPDGTNWYYFTKLVQSTSTSVSNAVVQPDVTISAATSTLRYSMDLTHETYLKARVINVETTDGEASAEASVSW